MQKSKVFCGKGCENEAEIANILGVTQGCFPIKYLDLPLSITYPNARNFFALIDATRAKVEGWKLKLLSFAGRVELIRSMLHNLLAYWIFSIKLPASLIKELEGIHANFLWNEKMHYWSWDGICSPKDDGRAGLRKVHDLVTAAGIRLVWRLHNSNSAWAIWMRGHYLKQAHISQATSSLDSGS